MSGMKPVELYARVRYACQVEGLSQRETTRRFGIDTKTVRKMLAFSVPPGYRRSKPPARPKLDPFTPIIDSILEADRSAPPKQRHTAKRIYERLRDEHAYAGGYTTVKDYVREQQGRTREVFAPLVHPPSHAQVDFGEAVAVIGGVRQKIHFFCLDLPHSDAGFVKAYPADRIPVQVRQEVGNHEGEIVEWEAGGTAQGADHGALLLARLPRQLARAAGAVPALRRPTLAPLADRLGADTVARGQDTRALARAGDLGTDHRGGAGVRVDGEHQTVPPAADTRPRPSKRQAYASIAQCTRSQ